jgi:transposase
MPICKKNLVVGRVLRWSRQDDRRRTYISSVIATKFSGTSPDKRRKYDEAFKAEALRLASESRSTQAAARQLGISLKLLYRWQ